MFSRKLRLFIPCFGQRLHLGLAILHQLLLLGLRPVGLDQLRFMFSRKLRLFIPCFGQRLHLGLAILHQLLLLSFGLGQLLYLDAALFSESGLFVLRRVELLYLLLQLHIAYIQAVALQGPTRPIRIMTGVFSQ